MENTTKPAETQAALPIIDGPPAETHFCIGCERTLPAAKFICGGLDGYGSHYVCHECWAAFGPFGRTVATIIAAQSFDGGLCHEQSLESIESLLREIKEGLRR